MSGRRLCHSSSDRPQHHHQHHQPIVPDAGQLEKVQVQHENAFAQRTLERADTTSFSSLPPRNSTKERASSVRLLPSPVNATLVITQSMSRAGYADFFPAAPSVLAKKAQAAEKAAKEKARRVHSDDDRHHHPRHHQHQHQNHAHHHQQYDRDGIASGALSAASTASSESSAATSTLLTATPATSLAQLTPATASLSPPDASSPPASFSRAPSALVAHPSLPAIPATPAVEKAKHASALAPPSLASKEPPPRNTSIPTPKASPPAVVKPEFLERNCRIAYDPVLEKTLIPKKGKHPIYRHDGEGVRTCISAFPPNTPREFV